MLKTRSQNKDTQQSSKDTQLTADTHLPLLVDDGYCVLQLDVVEEAGEKDIGYANEAVVLLLVEKGVGSLEVATHHLGGGRGISSSKYIINSCIIFKYI